MRLEVPKIPESIERVKDRVFDEYMKIKIMEDFYNGLHDYFSEDEIDIFRKEFATLDDAQFASIISLPYELRGKVFERLYNTYQDGNPLEMIVSSYIEQVTKHNFSIGYHTSPLSIMPTEQGRWNIQGTEADHRDNDRMMAYYSTQYRHLFKKRHPKYIYAVRSSLSDGTHKSDGNWHRGDSLSVIMKVPFDEVTNYVESMVRQTERLGDENHRAAAA